MNLQARPWEGDETPFRCVTQSQSGAAVPAGLRSARVLSDKRRPSPPDLFFDAGDLARQSRELQ